ncbi:hypothetical protein M5D96_007412 [Drosophila gunungcola]|uniref:Uncharacterized protein n=1 Tax=Drosophila gunungcola TaxID=103775 RepID=A0A9P9YN62_9MUSC|nr:hypothetical protein M5D96_007412 [Drosophila gunungcola]
MNILKKSHVLNQNCLRDKIQELSPLLRNLDWPANKDSVFRAAWSYYASGCQERLTTIRRRIEQNARMVAPNKRIGAPLPVDLKLPFNESQLTPGLDADEHIYRELVSCFRNAKSTASIKKTPQKRSKIQRPFDMSKFSTPEQWINWKREEQQTNELDSVFIETVVKKKEPKEPKKIKKTKKRRVVETMEVEKTPSKPIKISCSLCNLVRRRQSELRPYMQRMQKERQRLELKTYYTQKLLKCRPAQELNVQEQKRACARELNLDGSRSFRSSKVEGLHKD